MKRIFNMYSLAICFVFMLFSNTLAVDMTVFGLKLGEKFSVIECERNGTASDKFVSYKSADKSVCFKRYIAWGEVLSVEPIVDDNVTLEFPYSETPNMAVYNTIKATVIAGRLEGISFYTRGISDADDILTTLTTKYGKPTVLIPMKTQNRFGASFNINIANWTFTNLNVSFYSALTTIDKGSVQIDTKIGKAARDKKMSDANTDKRPL